jgi:alkanesulfonate monooxygenase SsuD/methylene tetrahydromethanopterin reductase-like flavin-dependent oxidoreductase (luciferase family)
MEVGIGLPATIPGVTGAEVVDWARRSNERGFSSLGVIDRIVYPNYEPMVTLGAAAAVTERIRLMPAIAIVPYRANTALFAKQALTVDNLSGGRLVMGMAIGGREDDYAASAVDFHQRGRFFDIQLEEIKAIWAGESHGHLIGPPATPPGGPPVLIGGEVDASFRRAVRHGDGWIMGGGTPDQFKEGLEKLRQAWSEAGREGEPRTAALAYYSLGEQAEENAQSYLQHYYGWLGEELAGAIAASAATDAETVRQYRDAFAQAGCDELIFFPCSTNAGQVDLLAEAVLE